MEDINTVTRKSTPTRTSEDKLEIAKSVESRTKPAEIKIVDEDDTANEAELSPPPSSSVSSVNPDFLGDEIVVGTRANGAKTSPARVVSEPEDEELADGEDEVPASYYPKRKRSAIYANLSDEKPGLSEVEEVNGGPVSRTPVRNRQGQSGVKDVILGCWRDSPVPKVQGKHAVIGFIDSRDRLRTKVKQTTRTGEPINSRLFPLPPGPGGSWVTFNGIHFNDHLVGLDHHQIKEYVKVRSEATADNDADSKEKADLAAAKEAQRRLKVNPPPESVTPVPVAWGADIPDNAQTNRPESKRRRTGSAIGTIAECGPSVEQQSPVQANPQVQPLGQSQTRSTPLAPPAQAALPVAPIPLSQAAYQQHSNALRPLDNLQITRPTRILVGCWSKSDVEDPRERHAVYGILGANDMFRVKLVRETMNGKYVNGNFPNGAGALWIPYEDVVFLNHIQGLSRPEMKEYVRVRQYQIDCGESEEQRVANETKAVYDAQQRAAAAAKMQGVADKIQGVADKTPRHLTGLDQEDGRESTRPEPIGSPHELRHARREVMPRSEPQAQGVLRHPMHDHEMRHIGPIERIQGLATREISRIEAVSERNLRHEQNRVAMMGNMGDPMDNRRQFQDNRDRMQKVWAQEQQQVQQQQQQAHQQQHHPQQQQQQQQQQQVQQQQVHQQQYQQQQLQQQAQSHVQPVLDDSKMHNGIRYERKQNGPFAGKLVGQGTIISIDGEDYVEYRVLTKPTFF